MIGTCQRYFGKNVAMTRTTSRCPPPRLKMFQLVPTSPWGQDPTCCVPVWQVMPESISSMLLWFTVARDGNHAMYQASTLPDKQQRSNNGEVRGHPNRRRRLHLPPTSLRHVPTPHTIYPSNIRGRLSSQPAQAAAASTSCWVPLGNSWPSEKSPPSNVRKPHPAPPPPPQPQPLRPLLRVPRCRRQGSGAAAVVAPDRRRPRGGAAACSLDSTSERKDCCGRRR